MDSNEDVELAGILRSMPIRYEGCDHEQFELNFDWDSSRYISDSLVVYYVQGQVVGWFDLRSRNGSRP